MRSIELGELISQEAIELDVEAADWREAVVAAGDLLVAGGVADEQYPSKMIEVVEEIGPYIVIAPGIALPHARPEDGTRKTGLSLVRLSTPVAFGHENNDPVELVIALAATDADSHVQALAQLAERLSEEETLAELRGAPTSHEAWRVLCGDREELGR